jgi:hypothetical protein
MQPDDEITPANPPHAAPESLLEQRQQSPPEDDNATAPRRVDLTNPFVPDVRDVPDGENATWYRRNRLETSTSSFADNHGLAAYKEDLWKAAHYQWDDYDARAVHEETGLYKSLQGEHDEPFWTQPRSFKAVVIAIGLLSGSCQGWYQSVIATTRTWGRKL